MCHKIQRHERVEQRRGSHDNFDPQLVSAVIEADSAMIQLCSRGGMKSSGATRNSGMQFAISCGTDDSP